MAPNSKMSNMRCQLPSNLMCAETSNCMQMALAKPDAEWNTNDGLLPKKTCTKWACCFFLLLHSSSPELLGPWPLAGLLCELGDGMVEQSYAEGTERHGIDTAGDDL